MYNRRSISTDPSMPEHPEQRASHRSATRHVLNLKRPRIPALIIDRSDGGCRMQIAPARTAKILRGHRLELVSGVFADVIWPDRLAADQQEIGVEFDLKRCDPQRLQEFAESITAESRPRYDAMMAAGRSSHDFIVHVLVRVSTLPTQPFRGTSLPLHNIVARMVLSAGCDRVLRSLVETEMADADQRLDRLDFFAKSRYLGYALLRRSTYSVRTIRVAQVARAVIVVPEAASLRGHSYAIDATNAAYVTHARYRAMVGGERFDFNATSYQQQSIRDGTCVHAAVAMASSHLARVFRTRPLEEVDVVSATTNAWARHLYEDDIVAALNASGFRVFSWYRIWTNGECYDGNSAGGLAWSGRPGLAEPCGRATLNNIIHIAADSCIPGILMLRPLQPGHQRHVVTLMGHTASRQPTESVIHPRTRMAVTTDWVRDIIVHDDSIGPYLHLPLRFTHAYKPDRYDPRWTLQEEVANRSPQDYRMLWDRSVEGSVQGFIMPVPNRVRFSPGFAHDALEAAVEKLLNDALSQKTNLTNTKLAKIAKRWHVDKRSVVRGVYLDHAERFRHRTVQWLAKHHPRKSEREIELLSQVRLPEYVYVGTLANSRATASSGTFGSRCWGYVLIDATVPEESNTPLVLARLADVWHWPSDEPHAIEYISLESPGLMPEH
jgi:hypothetical protein